MARVGEDFPLACPNCGGDIRLIAFITEPGLIRKILTHLGEPLEPEASDSQKGSQPIPIWLTTPKPVMTMSREWLLHT